MKQIIFALCWSGMVWADPQVLKMEVVSNGPAGGSNQLSLPFLVGKDQNKWNLLNEALFMEQIEEIAPAHYQKHMSYLKSDEYGTLADLNYTVLFQNSNFMVIEWNGEGCGAYCSTWTSYSFLDLSNYTLLSSSDLIAADQKTNLARYSLNQAQKQYRKQIQIEKKALRLRHISDEDRDRSETIIAEYKDCYQRRKGYLDESNMGTGINFYLTPKELVVIEEDCFPHVIQALDEVGEVRTSIPKGKFEKYLSPLAKDLLFNPKHRSPAPLYPSIHKAKIAGKYPITLVFDYKEAQKTGIAEGYYYYDKYLKKIELRGIVNGDQLELNAFAAGEVENTDADDLKIPTESFVLQTNQGKWSGTWQARGKELQIIEFE